MIWQHYDPHNCAVSVLQWDGDSWHAVTVNDIAHLPPEAIVNAKAAYEA